MKDTILNHDRINFNEIEKVVFGNVCEEGLSIVKGLMENLDLDTIGRTSLNLVERIIDNAVDNSYRESARNIQNTTVTKVNHQTIKNKVDFAGAAIEKLENVRVEKYLNNELKGKKESKILFEEKDGVFLRIHGKKHKQELKLAKVYEGWRKYIVY